MNDDEMRNRRKTTRIGLTLTAFFVMKLYPYTSSKTEKTVSVCLCVCVLVWRERKIHLPISFVRFRKFLRSFRFWFLFFFTIEY